VTDPEAFIRSQRRRRRRGTAPELEPEPEGESEPKPLRPLVAQGGRSEPARPAPPSVDDAIRDAIAGRRGGGSWTPIG
jgi:hypothetical protein